MIDLTNHADAVWVCWTHDIKYDRRAHLLDDRLDDRCPASRLEEWRAHRWEATADVA